MKYIAKMQIGMHNLLKYACLYEIFERFVKRSVTYQQNSIKVLELIRVNSKVLIRLIWPLDYCAYFIRIYILIEIESMI